MRTWNIACVSLCFNSQENDESLIRQAMECLGYGEESSEFCYPDFDRKLYGIHGPYWNKKS